MDGHGIPNDLMQNFDPISIIVFFPLLEISLPPAARLRFPSPPSPVSLLGFWFASLAMMYAAIMQHLHLLRRTLLRPPALRRLQGRRHRPR